MSGDPRVLAPLQQAFNATDNERTQRAIESAWEHETDSWNVVTPHVVERILTWTPPPAEPSLEQRVAELEAKAERHLVYLRDCIDSTEDRLAQRISSLEQHPEPTAPDDYTPGQYKRARGCAPPINPAPQPAPDLDPVRVEAAAKAAYAAVYPGDEWDELWPVAQKARIETASRIIRAYLKDGGA